MTAEISAFREWSRAEIEERSDQVDWDELVEEVQELDDIISHLDIGTGATAPAIKNETTFAPGGWAGEFAGGVRVAPAAKDSEKGETIDTETYNELVAGARRVAGTYGVRTASAYLSLMPQSVREARSLYLAYSRRLIQITERLLDGRLPVAIERSTTIGYTLDGQPDFGRTMKEQVKGTGRVASRQLSFSIVTAVTRLLARFHQELAVQLTVVSDDLGLQDERLDRQVGYHRRVRNDQLPADVVTQSATENTPSASELDQMQSSQQAPVRELATLWRGYQRDQATTLDWRNRFDAAVKPVQRVYELWCLERILEVLTETFGSYTVEDPDRLPVPKHYRFGSVELFYDRSVRDSSTYVDEYFREPDAEVGNPDFLIRENGEALWVADAKFQSANRIDTSGLYRFLGYLVDFVSNDDGHGALLCAAGSPIVEDAIIEGRQVQTVATAADIDAAEATIRKGITSALGR